MERKRLAVELKAEQEGALKVVFATFGVTDHDGDVTLPGAFEIGAKAPIAGVGHNWNIPTIGGGTIQADEKSVWLDGLLNLKMPSAREHYESIKFDIEQGIAKQEYSYAYDVVKGHSARPDEIKQYGPGTRRVLEALKVHEVSPVLLGAGIGTGTLAVKSALRLADHFALVMDDVKGLASRMDEVGRLRAEARDVEAKEGRVLSEGNEKLVESVITALIDLLERSRASRAGKAIDDTALLRSKFRADVASLSRRFGIQITT